MTDPNTAYTGGDFRAQEGEGFCFDCKKPVRYRWPIFYTGVERPSECCECGGHDVEAMGRVSDYLWKKLEQSQTELSVLKEGVP